MPMMLGLYLDHCVFPLSICPKASAMLVFANVVNHVNELRWKLQREEIPQRTQLQHTPIVL